MTRSASAVLEFGINMTALLVIGSIRLLGGISIIARSYLETPREHS